jgi:hypothetical protein
MAGHVGAPHQSMPARAVVVGSSVRAAESRGESRRWLALIVVLVAGFMDLLDVTIVNVAVPSVLKDLHATYAQVEWVVAAYVMGFAAVLITGGRPHPFSWYESPSHP